MFSRLRTAICICATVVFLGVVCVEASVPAAPQAADVVTVKMNRDHKFVPETVTIKVGQTVEWDNEEPGGVHQVTTDQNVAIDPTNVSTPEGAPPFDSKMIKSGNSFQHKFTVAGVYKYACPPHENDGMIGQVIVK